MEIALQALILIVLGLASAATLAVGWAGWRAAYWAWRDWRSGRSYRQRVMPRSVYVLTTWALWRGPGSHGSTCCACRRTIVKRYMRVSTARVGDDGVAWSLQACSAGCAVAVARWIAIARTYGPLGLLASCLAHTDIRVVDYKLGAIDN